MSDNQTQQYQHHLKMAWVIYILLTIVFIAVLVLFVARDMEEQFFYTIMPAAAAYVLRPTEAFFARHIEKFTGVTKPAEPE